MRIDGYSSYSLDRPTRPSTAVTPYRESQQSAEQAAEQRQSAIQVFERAVPLRQVTQVAAASEVRSYETERDVRASMAGLNTQVARALASYALTARQLEDGSGEVLGLDLYA